MNNPIYIGKIEHKAKDKIYDGLHEPIIDRRLWDNVQDLLKSNKTNKLRNAAHTKDKGTTYMLRGILENPNGYSMTPSTRKKKDKAYRYYVSMEAIKKGAKNCPVRTVSAHLIEEVVLDRIRHLLGSPEWVRQILSLDENTLGTAKIRVVTNDFMALWDELFPVEQARIVALLVHKIVLHPDRMLIHFLPLGLVSLLQELKPDLNMEGAIPTVDTPVTLEIPIRLAKRGARKYIKAPGGHDIVRSNVPKYDHALIKAVVRAHKWTRMLKDDEASGTRELAEQEGLRDNYVQKIIKLVDLAPDITEAILNGRQPYSLTLSQMSNIPLCWAAQRERFGFDAQGFPPVTFTAPVFGGFFFNVPPALSRCIIFPCEICMPDTAKPCPARLCRAYRQFIIVSSDRHFCGVNRKFPHTRKALLTGRFLSPPKISLGGFGGRGMRWSYSFGQFRGGVKLQSVD